MTLSPCSRAKPRQPSQRKSASQREHLKEAKKSWKKEAKRTSRNCEKEKPASQKSTTKWFRLKERQRKHGKKAMRRLLSLKPKSMRHVPCRIRLRFPLF